MAFQPLNQHWHLAALMQKLLQIIQCLHHFHSSLLSHSSQSLARLWVFDAPPRRPQIPAHPLKYCACLQPENLMLTHDAQTLRQISSAGAGIRRYSSTSPVDIMSDSPGPIKYTAQNLPKLLSKERSHPKISESFQYRGIFRASCASD